MSPVEPTELFDIPDYYPVGVGVDVGVVGKRFLLSRVSHASDGLL